jgi:hypothetical protein
VIPPPGQLKLPTFPLGVIEFNLLKANSFCLLCIPSSSFLNLASMSARVPPSLTTVFPLPSTKFLSPERELLFPSAKFLLPKTELALPFRKFWVPFTVLFELITAFLSPNILFLLPRTVLSQPITISLLPFIKFLSPLTAFCYPAMALRCPLLVLL